MNKKDHLGGQSARLAKATKLQDLILSHQHGFASRSIIFAKHRGNVAGIEEPGYGHHRGLMSNETTNVVN